MIVGDGMIDLNPRRIQDVTQDHIEWIKSQLIKKNNFMYAKGRMVYVRFSNDSESRFIRIPDKSNPNYRKAWADVYNLAIEYLENSLKEYGNRDNYDIILPPFDYTNAQYARTLEMMLEEFKKYKAALNEKKDEIKVSTRTISLEPVDKIKIGNIYAEELEKRPLKITKENVFTKTSQERVNTPLGNINEKNISKEKNDNFIIQKASDGELLDDIDFSNLKEKEGFVIVPCRDINKTKEERLFLDNMQKCEDEEIKTGAFLYGHANDEGEAAIELKRISKLLNFQSPNFTGLVIYEINDDYVLKNKSKEMKLLSFVNAYTIITDGLAKLGYIPMISMNIESKKILEDIYHRYNLESKCEICYIVLAREIGQVDQTKSTILVDPQYDYDLVTICDTPFKNNEILKNIIKQNQHSKS